MLRAIGTARKFLEIPDRGLVDGEAWAIAQGVERLKSGGIADATLVDAYKKVLASYAARV